MNLILFVLSLILILATMTYSRFESFTKGQVQAENWREILMEAQRDRYNQHQKKCRPPTPKKEKRAVEEKPKKSQEAKKSIAPGSGQISLAWLLDKKFRESKPEANKEMTELIHDLLVQQWGQQPFYKRLAKDHPHFVRALLNDIIATADQVKDVKKGVKNLDQLIMMDWNDLELKTAFGRMLQEGLVYNKKFKRQDGHPDVTYDSPQGFQSLRDFFTSRHFDKIRVWLAPRGLLLAIFRDPALVEEVVQMRQELYSEARKEGTDKEALSKQFEEAFSSKTVYKEVLDWHVTTTKVHPS